MIIITGLLLTFFLVSLIHVPFASATCCLAKPPGVCKDGTGGTPCCGYGKCNGFCCDCAGGTVIQQEIDLPDRTFVETITAPPGVTWTCRADHATPAADKREMATGSPAGPSITVAPEVRQRMALADEQDEQDLESDDILMQVSNGTGMVTLDQYLGYFGLADANAADLNYRPHKAAIIDLFNQRDRDGNGVLTKEEIDLTL